MYNKLISSIIYLHKNKRAIVVLVEDNKRRKWVTAPVDTIIYEKNEVVGFKTWYTTYMLKKKIKVDFVDTESAKIGNNCYCIINGESISTSTVIWSYVTSYYCEVETKNTIYYQ